MSKKLYYVTKTVTETGTAYVLADSMEEAESIAIDMDEYIYCEGYPDVDYEIVESDKSVEDVGRDYIVNSYDIDEDEDEEDY